MVHNLDEYLNREVPGWRNDGFAKERFKAFTGQKRDWGVSLNFWKDLIVKVARHLDLIVIDTCSVQQEWFMRDGVTPMGLHHVLVEMKKSGELETLDHVLGARPSRLQWVCSVLKRAIGWAALVMLSDSVPETETPIDERLVVMPILQEKCSQFLKTLVNSHYSSICIATLGKIKELCGGSEEAELIVGYLLLQEKALFMSLDGDDPIEGFKVSLNENEIAPISENDFHILQLHGTMEMLQLRLNTLDNRISMARNSALMSINAREKQEALRYVRTMKLLQLRREQCAGSMDKIDQVLGIIADAETTKKVSQAIQVSTAAIKDNHVSLEEVQHTLTELDEAITLQRETEEAIVGTPLSSSTEVDDAALDDELTLLEEELEAKSLNIPDVPKFPIGIQKSQEAASSEVSYSDPWSGETELQEELAKLAMELGKPLPGA